MSGHSSLQSCCTLLIRAVRPTRQERGRNLRPAYWNANSIRSKKLELVQFLLDHGIDICHINETHLMPGQEFRLANYVCHRNDRPTQDGGTMILVRRGIEHYSVPVSNLRQMEPTAICVNIGGRPVKLVAVNLSSLRYLLDVDLLECISRGTPVLLAGNLNAKHKDWNSRLNSPRRVVLREFASTNPCIVYGPDSPTTIPTCPTVTPDVLDVVVVKDFVIPLNLTVCSALSSDHFPVTVDLRGHHLSRPFQTGQA